MVLGLWGVEVGFWLVALVVEQGVVVRVRTYARSRFAIAIMIICMMAKLHVRAKWLGHSKSVDIPREFK